MQKYRERTAVLLILLIFMTNLTGCWPFDNKQTARAGVNQKLELALKYLADNQFEQAILEYNEVIRIDAKNTTAYKGLSLAYSLQNKVKEAKATLNQGLKAVPGSQELTLAMAGFMVDVNEPEAAEALYEQLLTAQPEYTVYQAYARFLLDQNRGSKAVLVIQKALAQNPRDYRLQNLAIDVYIKSGDMEKARKSALASISQEPNQSRAYHILEQIYQGRWADMRAFADQYGKSGNSLMDILLTADSLVRSGQYTEAIADYQSLDPAIKKLPRLLVWLAEAQYLSGAKPDAIQTLNKINLDDLKDAGMLAEISKLYMDLGNAEKAKDVALKGITIDGSTIENFALLALLNEGQQKRIWELRYALGCPISSQNAELDFKTVLSNNGTRPISSDLPQKLNSGEQPAAADKPSSAKIQKPKTSNEQKVSADEIILKTIYWPDSAAKSETNRGHFDCFYDSKKNIVYTGQIYTSTNLSYFGQWTSGAEHIRKVIVFRIHNPHTYLARDVDPQLKDKMYGYVGGIDSNVRVIQMGNAAWYRVFAEGDFDQVLKQANYPTDSAVFVDIDASKIEY